jgi:hypothetical protein
MFNIIALYMIALLYQASHVQDYSVIYDGAVRPYNIEHDWLGTDASKQSVGFKLVLWPQTFTLLYI